MEILRIGFIGAGGNTRLRHLPGFQKCEGVEPFAVCNRSLESSQKVAEEFGISHSLTNWRQIIDHPDVDAVCIGTWPNTHAQMTIAALEAGKHVLCEARMAANLVDAEAMFAASRARPDLVAQLVPSPLTLNLDTRIIALIQESVIGKLQEVFVAHTFADYQHPEAPLSWRLDRRLSGVNALTLGILHEMVQRWIPGDPEVLQALAGIYTPVRLDDSTGEKIEVDLPEGLDVSAQFMEGPRVTYHISGVDAGPPILEARLNGTTGTLRVDIAHQTLTLYGQGNESGKDIEVPPEENLGWRVEEDFIASIRYGMPVTLTDFESGIRYMRFSQAVDDTWRKSLVSVT